MDDYISRAAAIDELEERLRANGYTNVALVSELNRSIGYIMRIPAADVQPVKRGRWVAFGNTGLASCECGYITDRHSVYCYCPNCGARMVSTEGSGQ